MILGCLAFTSRNNLSAFAHSKCTKGFAKKRDLGMTQKTDPSAPPSEKPWGQVVA